MALGRGAQEIGEGERLPFSQPRRATGAPRRSGAGHGAPASDGARGSGGRSNVDGGADGPLAEPARWMRLGPQSEVLDGISLNVGRHGVEIVRDEQELQVFGVDRMP